LDRAGAVSLLKEIIHECESFIEAQAVSISKAESGWILKAKWICPQFERDCLRGIMLKHSVLISELDDYTVFC
jgi:hypothetical protein